MSSSETGAAGEAGAAVEAGAAGGAGYVAETGSVSGASAVAGAGEMRVLCGYISVYSALLAKSRPVYKVLLDRERFEKVRKSAYHAAEKRQYAILKQLCSERGVPVRFVSFEGKEALYGAESGGIAAQAGERRCVTEEELLSAEKPFLALLDGIEDPYNFGQMLRSFYASGVDGVVVPKRCFFGSDAIVARSSAGASELLRVCEVGDLEAFCEKAKARGVFLCATAAAKGAADLFSAEFRRPLCVVFGGERRGISKKLLERCDVVLRIGYPRGSGISLSASSAAAVIAFEIGRRII